MRNRIPLPPLDDLVKSFLIDEDGFLVWRVHENRLDRIGKRVTGMQVKYGCKQYYVSRIIWKMLTGREPSPVIDHRNMDKLCHTKDNLREATRSQNAMNKRVHSNNRLGVKGVQKRKSGSYQARISIDGLLINLSHFATLEDAKAAHVKGVQHYHGEFGRVE